MSGVDQRSGGIRVRRLLTRVLVFTGTTVAGTSAAWLLGAGIAAASSGCLLGELDTSSEVPAVDTVRPESGSAPHERRSPDAAAPDAGRHDAATFGLADLDPALLAPQSCSDARPGSRDVLAPVEDSVRDVVDDAEPVLSPVRRAAGAVLPGKDGPQPLPETVDEGLEALEPLVPTSADPPPEDLSPPPPPSGDEDRGTGDPDTAVPPRAPAPVPPADVVPSVPTPRTPAAATGTRVSVQEEAAPSRVGRSHAPAVPHAPSPEPFRPVPAVVPAAAVCGFADGNSSSSLGLGSQFLPAPRCAPLAGTASGHGAYALPAGTDPQPGTTPD